MNHDEMIAVIQAHKDGKKIECSRRGPTAEFDRWFDAEPSWQFGTMNYRVKVEPKEFYAVLREDGEVTCIYPSKFRAEQFAAIRHPARKVYHLREVM